MSSVLCKVVSVLIQFIWTLICGSLAIHKLRNINDDFVDILDGIPEPQVRIVNDEQFLGPVHIICSQPLINTTNVTCDDIFNKYDPITSNQQYFSWLYLDPNSPITNTTIDDISSSRYILFIILAISVFLGIINTCVDGLASIQNKELAKEMGQDDNPCFKLFILIAKQSNKLSLYMTHMLMCNTLSISEYSPGLFILEYIPSYAIFAVNIALIAMCCVCCYCFIYSAIIEEENLIIF